MPIGRLTLIRATAVFTAAGVLILLGMVALTFWTLERTRHSTDEVLSTREMRSALVDLLSVIQDAETGQRGYLLTGEERYLAPYHTAVEQTDERFAKLSQALRNDPAREPFLSDLHKYIGLKLAELSKTVALKRGGDDAGAMKLVLSDEGKEAMDHIRRRLDEKRHQVEDRLTQAITEQRANGDTLKQSIIGGGLLIVLASLGVAWAIATYTRELVHARTEVESLNAGLELRVKERTVDLERANEEIQRFAYIVSHDLRAPLVNIMGFTAELKSSLDDLKGLVGDPAIAELPAAASAKAAVETDVPEAISFIQASTKKMDALINAILKLSREGRRTLNPERVDLAKLFEGISASTQHQLVESGGELIIEGQLPTVIADRLSLEQVFGNIVDNAVKYQAPGRAPVVRVRAESHRDGTISVEIEDNGRGIARDDHGRVFDLFRRAGAQDKPGEGIGLAHVQALVRRLGGQITLTSEVGSGSIFRVRFPRDLRQTLERIGELSR